MRKIALGWIVLLLAAGPYSVTAQSLEEKSVRREKIASLEEKMTTLPISADICLELAELYAEDGLSRLSLPRITQLYLDASRLKPDDPEVLSAFAGYFFRCRQTDLARELAEKTLSLSPEDPDALLVLAKLLLNGDDPAEVARLLDKVLEKNPDSARALLLKGELRYWEYDLAVAQEYLEQARDLVGPGEVWLNSEINSLLKQIGSISQLEEAVASGQANEEDYRNLERFLSNFQRAEPELIQDQLISILKKEAEQSEEPWQVYTHLGYILSSRKDYDDGREAFFKALELLREDNFLEISSKRSLVSRLHRSLAKNYFNAGKDEKALEFYSLAYYAPGFNMLHFTDLGDIYSRQGKYWEAAVAYRAAEKPVREARARRTMNDFPTALKILWKAIRKTPNTEPVDQRGKPVKNIRYQVKPDLYRGLGQTYREMGEPVKAMLAFWEAYTIDSRDGKVIEELFPLQLTD